MYVFNQFLNELKVSKKIIALGIVVSSVIISMVIIFLNLKDFLMPQIYENYNNQFSDGILVNVYQLDIEQVHILEELGAKELEINADSITFSNAEIRDNNNRIINDKQMMWLNENNLSEEGLAEEFDFKEFNYSDYAILYCNSEIAASYKLGDEFILSLESGKEVERYELYKIIIDERIDEPKITVPLYSVIKNINTMGYRISHDINFIQHDIVKYLELKDTLREQDALCKSYIDTALEISETLSYLFKLLGVIFTVISVFAIFELMVININTRERFLVLQRILGAKKYKIVTVYVLILEIQIIISDVIGSILGMYYTKYLSGVLKELYDFSITINISEIYGIILKEIIISNISLIPIIVVINRIINKKDIISVINKKE